MNDAHAHSASAGIAPWLSVTDAQKAIEYYQAAFDAVERYRLEYDEQIQVAQLAVGDADFWVQNDPDNSPAGGRRSIRMILTVDDPDPVFEQALDAGGTKIAGMSEGHGWRIGRLEDPFGHHWEVGKQLPDS